MANKYCEQLTTPKASDRQAKLGYFSMVLILSCETK